MLVGLHEAIHEVGLMPSFMNTVARLDAWLLWPVVNADDSQTRPSGLRRAAPRKAWAPSGGSALHEVRSVGAISIPGKRSTRLVFDHAGFKEIALFLQVNHFAHPRERIFLVGEERFQADLRGAAVRDVAQIALEHGGIEAQHATWHGVLGIAVFELDRLLEQRLDFGLEFRSPEVRVLEL